MCCPHGEAFISPDPQEPMQKECKRPGIQQRYSPIFHDESESEITGRIGKEDYRLIAPKEGQFECPESDFGKSFQPLLYFADHTGFKTYTDGSLRGIVIDGYDENATEHGGGGGRNGKFTKCAARAAAAIIGCGGMIGFCEGMFRPIGKLP